MATKSLSGGKIEEMTNATQCLKSVCDVCVNITQTTSQGK